MATDEFQEARVAFSSISGRISGVRSRKEKADYEEILSQMCDGLARLAAGLENCQREVDTKLDFLRDRIDGIR